MTLDTFKIYIAPLGVRANPNINDCEFVENFLSSLVIHRDFGEAYRTMYDSGIVFLNPRTHEILTIKIIDGSARLNNRGQVYEVFFYDIGHLTSNDKKSFIDFKDGNPRKVYHIPTWFIDRTKELAKDIAPYIA